MIIDNNGILKNVTDLDIKNGTFNIPEYVTQIGNFAFYDCTSLTKINLPKGITKIGKGAFNGCTRLTQINLPKGITEIGEHAFSRCTSLTQIDLPEGITKIGYGAFAGCTRLAQIDLPKGITKIGDFAFSRCTSLTKINLPKGITKISDGAFNGCTNLTQIDLPEGITKIGYGAFVGCTNLTQINLPKGITEIGAHAFSRCTSLTQIIIESDDENEIKRIKDMLPQELHQKIMTLEEKKATDLIENKLLPLVNNYLSHLLSAASKYNSNINPQKSLSPEESNTQKIKITDSYSPDYKIIAKKYKLVLELKAILNSKTNNSTAKERVDRFTKLLRDSYKEDNRNNKSVLSQHRNSWDHFVKTCLNILFIVPIGIYELSKGHSVFFFSKSHGGAFVEEAEEEIKKSKGPSS